MKCTICNLSRGLVTTLLLLLMLPGHAAALTDDEIASVVAAANVNEINAGKLAVSNAYKDKVKAFAQKMVEDHRNMDQQAGQLAVKLKLNPTPSKLSDSVKAQGNEMMESLKIAPKGPIFDKEFVGGQVMAHEQVLNLFNNELIPNARNQELKQLLEKSASKIESHLEQARRLHEEITANI